MEEESEEAAKIWHEHKGYWPHKNTLCTSEHEVRDMHVVNRSLGVINGDYHVY
jgi:hypothetical protein